MILVVDILTSSDFKSSSHTSEGPWNTTCSLDFGGTNQRIRFWAQESRKSFVKLSSNAKGIADYLSKCARVCLHQQRASCSLRNVVDLERFASAWKNDIQLFAYVQHRYVGRESELYGLFEDLQCMGKGANEEGRHDGTSWSHGSRTSWFLSS